MTARGFSTKDNILHIECENHVMGKTSEKCCYCRTFLCINAISRDSPLLMWVLSAGTVLLRIFFKWKIRCKTKLFCTVIWKKTTSACLQWSKEQCVEKTFFVTWEKNSIFITQNIIILNSYCHQSSLDIFYTKYSVKMHICLSFCSASW